MRYFSSPGTLFTTSLPSYDTDANAHASVALQQQL